MEPGRTERSAVVILLLLAGAAAFHFSNACTDDAFITFRYAENFARGKGLVFNPGERVEGYSNFLFAVLLALLAKLGMTGFPHGMLVLSKAIGSASGLGTALVVYSASGLLRRRDHPIVVRLLAFVLIATAMQFVNWAVGGLETTFCALLVALAQYFNLRSLKWKSTERNSQSSLFLISSVFYLLASLTRPEIPVLFAASVLTTGILFIARRWSISRLIPGIHLQPFADCGEIAE